MVHNGIEYSDMQLIAEAYDLLRQGLGATPADLAQVFREWNQGELESYLIEITADVLGHVDAATGAPFVDVVADRAEQKGTGRWTVQNALELGVPVTGIAEAVFARSLSALTDERGAARSLPGPGREARPARTDHDLVDDVRRALYASKIVAYAQGFDQIAAASAEYGWDIDRSVVASIWRGGCIIRARFLNSLRTAYTTEPVPPTLLADTAFADALAPGPGSVAPGRGHRGRDRRADARLLLGLGLLRRSAPGAPAGRPHPGAAGLLRCAHLRPRGSRRHLPHRLVRRPAGAPGWPRCRLSNLEDVDGANTGASRQV